MTFWRIATRAYGLDTAINIRQPLNKALHNQTEPTMCSCCHLQQSQKICHFKSDFKYKFNLHLCTMPNVLAKAGANDWNDRAESVSKRADKVMTEWNKPSNVASSELEACFLETNVTIARVTGDLDSMLWSSRVQVWDLSQIQRWKFLYQSHFAEGHDCCLRIQARLDWSLHPSRKPTSALWIRGSDAMITNAPLHEIKGFERPRNHLHADHTIHSHAQSGYPLKTNFTNLEKSRVTGDWEGSQQGKQICAGCEGEYKVCTIGHCLAGCLPLTKPTKTPD